MSLKSRKSIDTAGPDIRDETVITFRKEKDKTYTKITKTLSRDWKTGHIRKGYSKPTEDGPYVLVSDELQDFDEKVSYQDIDESIKFMYFKKIETNSES